MAITLVHWTPMYEIALKYTPQSIAIGATVYAVIFAERFGWVRALLEVRVVRHLGSISYEIYLWHALVFTVFTTWLGSTYTAAAISLCVSVLVSDLAYRLTTKRFKGIRRRFGGHPVS